MASSGPRHQAKKQALLWKKPLLTDQEVRAVQAKAREEAMLRVQLQGVKG